jgi:CO/xanthine dehydrogenase FAD-binding subunit
VLQIGGPAIRNFGTAGGNIANGSPKADSALIFFVMDSILRLVSVSGERLLPIKDFYLGRKKTALAPDELIAEILLPRSRVCSHYYKKVGARNAQAISRVAFAGLSRVEDDRILDIATAFGAVSDVIIRRAQGQDAGGSKTGQAGLFPGVRPGDRPDPRPNLRRVPQGCLHEPAEGFPGFDRGLERSIMNLMLM